MKRRLLLCAAVLVMSVHAVSAEGNTIYGGLGGGLSFPAIIATEVYGGYERDIVDGRLSVGLDISGQWFPFAIFAAAADKDRFSWYGLEAVVLLRWYPFGATWHIDAGAGYGDYMKVFRSAVLVLPSTGWKIKLGSGGLILDATIARCVWFLADGIKYMSDQNIEETLKPFNLLGVRISFGYSF